MSTLSYVHPDNKDKPFVDWREPEHRMEGFLRWLKWRLDWCDLDHYLCNNTYRDTLLTKRKKPMTKEQTYWFSLIFGMTYQSEMSWVIFNEFPDFWEIDPEKLQEWNIKNLPRQKYAKDCKYNKGRITQQYLSIKEKVKDSGSLVDHFDGLVSGHEHSDFERIYDHIKGEFYKFGRMTTWLACQTLHETAGLPIRPKSMLASDPSSWSVRSGLMYSYNRDDLIESKHKGLKLSASDIEWVEYKEQELMDRCLEYMPEHSETLTHYLLESHLCQYKKLMLGGDYSGHSSGDHVSRAKWLSERWPEVPFESFFNEIIQSHHPLVRGKRESKALRNLCAHTGQMINMHMDFEDMPDIYKEMEIDPEWLQSEDKKTEKVILDKITTYAELVHT
jgi:hypothetical protein